MKERIEMLREFLDAAPTASWLQSWRFGETNKTSTLTGSVTLALGALSFIDFQLINLS